MAVKAAGVAVIDGALDVLADLRAVRTDQGYQGRSAPDGAQSLKLGRERMPDVMCLDIGMPLSSPASGCTARGATTRGCRRSW